MAWAICGISWLWATLSKEKPKEKPKEPEKPEKPKKPAASEKPNFDQPLIKDPATLIGGDGNQKKVHRAIRVLKCVLGPYRALGPTGSHRALKGPIGPMFPFWANLWHVFLGAPLCAHGAKAAPMFSFSRAHHALASLTLHISILSLLLRTRLCLAEQCLEPWWGSVDPWAHAHGVTY